MDYTNAEIDAKIQQAVLDTLTFVSTQYVKQDGSTPISGKQYIEKIATTEVGNDSQEVNFECTANFNRKLTVPDSFVMKANGKQLSINAVGITDDREVQFPDNNGTIDVNP